MNEHMNFKQKSLRYRGSVTVFIRECALLILFISLFVLCSIFVDKFLTIDNIITILRQISFLAIVALGQFFVILTGSIDLSIGAIIGLMSIFFAGFIVDYNMTLGVALIVVFILAIIVGLTNGILTVIGKIPSFIATLVTMNVIRGIVFIYSQGLPISGLPAEFRMLGMGHFWIIPVPVVLMVILGAILHVFTKHTPLGRSFFAIGGNMEASRLSGINVKFVAILAFVLSAVLAGIGAIGMTSRTMAGVATMGEHMLFDIITVVVLGGTALTGGRGKVINVILAAMFIGVINNAMVLLGIDAYWQWIVKGIILLTVVLVDSNTRKD